MKDHQVTKAKLADIAPIFNLIQKGSLQGYFSNLYLQPRYQAGLTLQLFSIWLFGKIRLPTGIWYRADLHVIYHEDAFAGFVLMRHQLSLDADLAEIYMCAIEPSYREMGLGRLLIESVLDSIPNRCIVEAECLPPAVLMKHLLRNLGFRSNNSIEESALINTAEKFCLLHNVLR